MKKIIFALMSCSLMTLCLNLDFFTTNKPEGVLAWDSGYSYHKLTCNQKGVDFLEEYESSDTGNIGNLCLDLNGFTWVINEQVDTDSLDIGCLRIQNGYIDISEDMVDDTCFDVFGGLEFENVTFLGHSWECDHLVYFNGVTQGWNRCNVNNCYFSNCDSDENGGVFYFNFSDANMDCINITNCTFDSCWTNASGAGIYVEHAGEYGKDHKMNLAGTKFYNCKAYGDGGAVYINYHNVKISRGKLRNKCYFSCCSSHEGDGGAIYVNQSGCLIADCVFEGNWANDNGGAIYVNGDICFIVLCEFYKNTVFTYTGSAIYDDNSGCYLEGCTLINNSSDTNACYFNYDVTCKQCIFSNKYNFHPEGHQPTLDECQVDTTGTRDYSINLSVGTLMSNGSLVIIFGILALVFLASTGAFAFLYFAGKKKKISK